MFRRLGLVELLSESVRQRVRATPAGRAVLPGLSRNSALDSAANLEQPIVFKSPAGEQAVARERWSLLS
jgi:hypothetical protein